MSGKEERGLRWSGDRSWLLRNYVEAFPKELLLHT